MSTVAKKLLTSTKGGEEVSVNEVFSTYVYEGNGSTLDIVNGINLADEGGMVWFKARGAAFDNYLFDTERGATSYLSTNRTWVDSLYGGSQSFNTDGFTVGDQGSINNASGTNFVSWTFRKAPKFFDVVKYTGDGVAGREIAHNLGCEVGMIVVKGITAISSWYVYHRANTAQPETEHLVLNSTAATVDSNLLWYDTKPTENNFTLGSLFNGVGNEYIAYLFAHDDSEDSMIKCGSYAPNYNLPLEIDLGFEPQYLLIKNTNATADWVVIDSIRGVVTGSSVDPILRPNASDVEWLQGKISFTPNGFRLDNELNAMSASGNTYIYLAIARDTTTVPESSDEVFAIDTMNGATTLPAFKTNFPLDMVLFRERVDSTENNEVYSRLTGTQYLATNLTNSESGNIQAEIDYMDGWGTQGANDVRDYSWMFKRAKGFFDVVTYTGEQVFPQAVPHNLGVAPEMILAFCRTSAREHPVYHKDLPNGHLNHLILNTNAAAYGSDYYWDTTPTDTTVYVDNLLALSADDYILYLFATVDGVSKVCSYTGNGTSQTIDAGFTTGTKFLIVKRTDSIGDWIMVDSQRGLDNFIELNTTNAQASGSGISADVSGFTVTQNATTDLNASGGSYIYYAIAN